MEGLTNSQAYSAGYTMATLSQPLSKRRSRWKPRLCNCDLEPDPHLLRNKKAWRVHQLRLGKLQAGAADAIPRASSTLTDISDEYMSLGSSRVTVEDEAQSPIASLNDNDLSADLGEHQHLESLDGLTSSLPGIQQSLASADLTQATIATRPSPSFTDFDLPIAHPLEQSQSDSGNQVDLLPVAVNMVTEDPNDYQSDSLSSQDYDPLSGSGFYLPSSSSAGSGSATLSAKARFFSEVEDYIGNPEDWTDSDDEMIAGDLSEVRVFERGLVEEQASEEEFVELDDECSLPPSRSVEDIPQFLYENDSGKSPILISIYCANIYVF